MLETNMRTKSQLAKMDSWLSQFKNSRDIELTDVYSRPSDAKYRAWRECWNRYANTDTCLGFRILGHNCSHFVVAYMWADENGEVFFTVETYANTYTCSLADMGY